VDHCRLYLDPEENKLVFVFHCRHGRVRNKKGEGVREKRERERSREGGRREKKGEEGARERRQNEGME